MGLKYSVGLGDGTWGKTCVQGRGVRSDPPTHVKPGLVACVSNLRVAMVTWDVEMGESLEACGSSRLVCARVLCLKERWEVRTGTHRCSLTSMHMP